MSGTIYDATCADGTGRSADGIGWVGGQNGRVVSCPRIAFSLTLRRALAVRDCRTTRAECLGRCCCCWAVAPAATTVLSPIFNSCVCGLVCTSGGPLSCVLSFRPLASRRCAAGANLRGALAAPRLSVLLGSPLSCHLSVGSSASTGGRPGLYASVCLGLPPPPPPIAVGIPRPLLVARRPLPLMGCSAVHRPPGWAWGENLNLGRVWKMPAHVHAHTPCLHTPCLSLPSCPLRLLQGEQPPPLSPRGPLLSLSTRCGGQRPFHEQHARQQGEGTKTTSLAARQRPRRPGRPVL